MSQEIQTIKVKNDPLLSESDWTDISLATTFNHVYEDTTYATTLQDILNNLFVQSGTTNYAYAGGGYLTTYSKDLCFTIPVNKVIGNKTITSTNITACQLRQGSNYLFDSTVSDDLSTLSLVTTLSDCGIRCTLHQMSGNEEVAFTNASNNDAVGVYINVAVTWA